MFSWNAVAAGRLNTGAEADRIGSVKEDRCFGDIETNQRQDCGTSYEELSSEVMSTDLVTAHRMKRLSGHSVHSVLSQG